MENLWDRHLLPEHQLRARREVFLAILNATTALCLGHPVCLLHLSHGACCVIPLTKWMSSQQKSQIFLSAPSVAYSGVQGITKLWHIYILSLMTPQFALGSHLNGIRRSPGSCEFPVVRKLADVLPVWKKRKKDEISSYRPDSLNSVPDKIMEKMMLGVTENTWKTILSLETANTSSWREGPVELKVLLLRSHPSNWWKEANWCYCLGFHMGF